MGIDYIINPDLTTAIEIERYLMRSYNFYSDDFAKGKVSMVDFHVEDIKDFTGKKNYGFRWFRRIINYSCFQKR